MNGGFGPGAAESVDDRKLTYAMAEKIVSDGLASGKSNIEILDQLDNTTNQALNTAAITELDRFMTAARKGESNGQTQAAEQPATEKTVRVHRVKPQPASQDAAATGSGEYAEHGKTPSQRKDLISAQQENDEQLADVAEDVVAAALEIFVPPTSQMDGPTAKKQRDVLLLVMYSEGKVSHADLRAWFEITPSQAKDWSAKAKRLREDPEFEHKFKQALIAAAAERNVPIADVVAGINEKMSRTSRSEGVDKSISTSKEQGGPKDSDERPLRPAADAEISDRESNDEGLAIKGRKSGESVQEKFNAVDTNNAAVKRTMEALQAIDDGVENSKFPTAGEVKKAQAALDAKFLDVSKITEKQLATLALDAYARGDEATGNELRAELEDRLQKQTENATAQDEKNKRQVRAKAGKEERNLNEEAERAKAEASQKAKEAQEKQNSEDRKGLKVGDTVANPKLGTGVVESFAGTGADTRVTVKFKSGQTKELMVSVAKLEKIDAVQEQSTGEVDVRQPAGNGETVGEGNAKSEKPAGKGRKQKTEPKQETKPTPPQELKSDDERAGEAWDLVVAEYPTAPKWADLTKAQRDTFIEYGEDNWTPDDVRGELVKLAKAAQAETTKVEYPPKPQAGAPAYLEPAQRAVVDFMNGELTKDELLQRFADLSMTEAMIRSVTNRIDITKDEIDSVATLRGQQGVQQSRSSEEGTTFSDPDYLEDSLLSFVNRNALGNSVVVLEDFGGLIATPEFMDMSERKFMAFLAENGIDENTQAFVSKATGRAYLFANNIVVGKERGVFMHEVGVHLGMQSKLPRALFTRLVGKIQEWAAADNGSIESQLAAKALARAVSAGVSTAQRQAELVAYFVEEAVNAGINPTAYQKIQSAGLREWMRSLWAAFKNAIRMLRGLNIDRMTGQDVVDLAYGFAQMETAGRFHGANTKFRQFSTKFMGTGVGGQAYGWGLYFAQARPTAETYAVVDDDKEASFLGSTESRLYHVDLAINDDEWVKWGKPLSQQSDLVREALRKLGLYTSDSQIYDRPFLRNVVEKKAGSEKAASQMLDAAGIKGTMYRDATSADPSFNLVVFNEKNVIRVGDQRGVQTNADDRMAQPEFDWDEIQQSRRTALERLPQPLRKPAELTWKAMFKNAALPMMVTEDVVALAGKFMKSAGRYLQAQYDRQKARLQIEGKVEAILDRFDKLDAATQKLANEYIYDSTMQQKWGYYPGEHRVGTTLFEVDPDFKKRFEALPDNAQGIVRDVFEHGYQMLKLKQQAVDAAIDREFKAREDAAMGDADELAKIAKEKRAAKKRELAIRNIEVDKPYAYLGRHGDYVVVAKSKEFIAAEEIAKGERSSVVGDSVFGDPQDAKNWMQENVSNPEHYIVQFAETQGEADKIAADLIATGKYDVQPEDAGVKEASASYGGDAFLAVKRLRNMAERQGDVDPHLEKLLSDLYLATVAEASARKSELQRKYVAGADKNMMRNLATSGRADAHFLSTMLHNDEIVDSLEAMRDEARGNRRDAMPIYNELFARYTSGLDYRDPAPLVRQANRLSTVYYLSTSPAFYLQQILQTAVLSLPFISGRLGYFRSVRALNGAYKDVSSLVKGLSITDHIDFNKAPADVRGMLQTLVGMGKIDIGIDADAKARSGEQGVMSKVMRKLQGVNTRVEAINRSTAAIAAYRGYLQRYGASKTAEATKFAADVVSNTHGSYDGFNTPRVLNSDFGRFFLQFKRFQIIQLSMLAKLLHGAFKGASPEERLVARKTLGFITAHMAVLGGALGVPFVSQLGQALLSAFGDDDEPDNLEYMLRKAIGDDTLADLLLRGVPGAIGLESLGKKLAMENVASVLPFTDVDLSSRSGMEKVLVGLMGPTTGLGLKLADGLGMMAKGDYWKGLEQLMPTGISNLSKGLRYATEGITMRNGDTVMGADDISALDAAFQAVGLPTSTITDRQRNQSLVAEFDKFYQGRTAELKTEYAKAFKTGDSGAMQDAREEWMQLQDARARNGYSRQPLSNLFRAPMEQQKRERNVANGVEFNKNNRRFVETRNQ